MEERASIEKMLLSDWPLVHFLDGWPMWKGPVHFGGVNNGLLILGAARAQADKAVGSKPGSSTLPWLRQPFLPLGPRPALSTCP